ncbi:MAG: hypothetical protein V4681_01695 [Patescibacteria group bacterium]
MTAILILAGICALGAFWVTMRTLRQQQRREDMFGYCAASAALVAFAAIAHWLGQTRPEHALAAGAFIAVLVLLFFVQSWGMRQPKETN